MDPLRLVFMGTPDIAVPTLAALIGAGHDIVRAYSQPPRPAGRGHRERPSPVQDFAVRHHIDIKCPTNLEDPEIQAAFLALDADAAIVFAVDLVSVFSGEQPEAPIVDTPPTDLEITDVTIGEGDPVEAGDTITVHYHGTLLDGTVFDSSWDRGQPFTTAIGVGQVIAGWDEGMVGMRVGGRRILVIPSDLAYGESGSGGQIPPDAPLVFVVDLLSVAG